MTTPQGYTASRCRACGQPLQAPFNHCWQCGSSQDAAAPLAQFGSSSPYGQAQHGAGGNQVVPWAGPAQPTVVHVMAPKSVGIAVLLTILLLGAGHLYANRVATGLILIVTDVILVGIAATGVGLVVSIPVWCILIPLACFLSAQAVKSYNRRNGMTLR